MEREPLLMTFVLAHLRMLASWSSDYECLMLGIYGHLRDLQAENFPDLKETSRKPFFLHLDVCFVHESPAGLLFEVS
jgi:hypothetical protein